MLFNIGKKRRKKITDLEIEEVSLVDKPANQIPFMVIKSEGKAVKEVDEKVELVKVDSVKLQIETDFTMGNTSIKLNGKKIDNLDDIFFSMYGPVYEADYKGGVYLQYTQRESDDETTKTQTYSYGSKNEKESTMNENLAKALTGLFGEIPNVYENLNSDEQEKLAKQLSIIEEYSEHMPPVLAEAVGECILMGKEDSTIDSVVSVLTEALGKIKDLTSKEEEEEETVEEKVEVKETVEEKVEEEAKEKPATKPALKPEVEVLIEELINREPKKKDPVEGSIEEPFIELDDEDIEAVASAVAENSTREVLGD